MAAPHPQYEEKLKLLVRTLPDKPGVYQYLDARGTIIYVGKAKSLRKRVASYFNRDQQEAGKLRILVRRIADIHHIVVDSELDALLLENNLIKKYQPRYNVLLKDDKTFPWICIKNEPFPRIFPTRNLLRDGSRYYGPYASVRMMHTLLELIRQLFQYRSCRLALSQDNIKAGKFRRCLQYHIGNCHAPCEGLQTEENYMQTISQIEDILKGNLSSVMQQLRLLMKQYAHEQAFEKAHVVKEKIQLLEKFQSKSMVVSATIHNVDVFSILSEEGVAWVNYLKVVDGGIVQSHTLELRKKLAESDQALLEVAITELRARFSSNAPEAIVPLRPEIRIPGLKYTIPRKGDKHKLLELSLRNAGYYRLEQLRKKELTDPERHSRRILENLQKDLRLKKLPVHIECIDNSNTQGTYAVSALVVFRQARPSRKDYRHYNIRSVEGPDDYASMREVVIRRYGRLLGEKQPLPELLVVDGGKGQLSAALEGLRELGIAERLPVIGIAKRLEEIYFPGDPLPLYIDKKSESLRLIQHLRDEAHRFGITHHRRKREKGSLQSELSQIKGVGPATAQKLLARFGSVKGIKSASEQELQALLGPAKARLLKNYFEKDHGEEKLD